MRKHFAYVSLAVLWVLSLTLSGCLCFNPLSGLGGDVRLPLPVPLPGGAASGALTSEPGIIEDTPDFPQVMPPGPPDPPPAGIRVTVTGTLTLGASTQIGSQTIGPKGAEVTLESPNHPLSGLVLQVPPGAYPENQVFKFSAAPITGHTFKLVNPVTPLITIENGGRLAKELMSVVVPVKLAAGQFAMGFFYDARSGRVEGMPLLARDDKSITVVTLHFSSFFVSAIEKSVLGGDIDSGFRPGIDDWQFTNHGSYIAPDGHCAGQSVTALWYYDAKPDGAGATLYGRYDNDGIKPATPRIWFDDRLGYKFASVVQKDLDDKFRRSFESQFFNGLIGANPEMTWNAFSYAMRVTGEPQMTWIRAADGSGHAMVVYRVKAGNLYIADPNYPGNNERRIVYANSQFSPYNSGSNATDIAAGRGKSFDRIGYIAKTACFDWESIAAHWKEFKGGTIGEDYFPRPVDKYVIDSIDGSGKWDGNVVDGLVLDRAAFFPLIFDNNSQKRTYTSVYRDGQRLAEDTKERGVVKLNPGPNRLGIPVFLSKGNKKVFVDFWRVTVTFNQVEISPPELVGTPRVEYTFTAAAKGAPAGTLYEWSLENRVIQTAASNVFRHAFPAEGDYRIAVRLFDPDGTEIGFADACARIKGAALTLSPTSWAGEAGKPVAFTANDPNPPAKAGYEWYVNDKPVVLPSLESKSWTFPGGVSGTTYNITVKEFDLAYNPPRLLATATAVVQISARQDNNLARLQQMNRVLGYLSGGKFTFDVWTPTGSRTETRTTLPSLPRNPNYGPLKITWSGTSFAGNIDYRQGAVVFAAKLSGSVSSDGNTLTSLSYTESYTGGNTSTDKYVVVQNVSYTLQNMAVIYAGDTEIPALGRAPGLSGYVVKIAVDDQEWRDGKLAQKTTFKSAEWPATGEHRLTFSYLK
jgi:hypothetical protein